MPVAFLSFWSSDISEKTQLPSWLPLYSAPETGTGNIGPICSYVSHAPEIGAFAVLVYDADFRTVCDRLDSQRA